jgi:TolB protein
MTMKPGPTIAWSLVVLAWCVLLAPPAAATFPGDDGRIVFSYEAPVPGAGQTQADVYSMEPDGSGLRRLTATLDRNEFAPAWSADGTKIAFWRTRLPLGPASIWVMDADGHDRMRLTSGIDARDPAWSPNGRRIAFSRSGRRSSDIVTMRSSNGGGMHRVTRTRSLEFEPAWSPDGLHIAFTRGFGQGDVGDIWVIDLSNGRTIQVTSTPAYDHQVAWFPDGARLAFERATFNRARIVSVNPDGTGADTLSKGFFDADPAPSPTGTTIVFASDRIGGFLPDLWTMGSGGSNPQVTVDRLFASTTPDWQAIPVP